MTVFDWTTYYTNGPRIPYLDNCPSCHVGKLNTPTAIARHSDDVRADYTCWHCGHQWFTGWQRED